MSIPENDKPYVLILLNQWGYERVWVRPNYEAAFQTLRIWFALQLVGSKEVVNAAGNWPDPVNTSYDKIIEWVNHHDTTDMNWDVMLLPVNLNTDPLQEFIEYDLKFYPVLEQERLQQAAIVAFDRLSRQFSSEKASRPNQDPEAQSERDFSKATHTKDDEWYVAETKVVLLSPDVTEVFTDSESVNEALRALIRIGRQPPKKS